MSLDMFLGKLCDAHEICEYIYIYIYIYIQLRSHNCYNHNLRISDSAIQKESMVAIAEHLEA
jgi:hypothetical protein